MAPHAPLRVHQSMSSPEAPRTTHAGTRAQSRVADPTKIEFYLRPPVQDERKEQADLPQHELYIPMLAVVAAAALAIAAVA